VRHVNNSRSAGGFHKKTTMPDGRLTQVPPCISRSLATPYRRAACASLTLQLVRTTSRAAPSGSLEVFDYQYLGPDSFLQCRRFCVSGAVMKCQ
jgi:hypothetical protein